MIEPKSEKHELKTQRTTVKRLPKRGAYERDAIYRILDEGLICHLGFEAGGHPYVIPTGYARAGDTLFIHGSPASRMLRTLGTGAQVCVTVTLLDGLVVARSAFHSSMNYRSVVILGIATEVTDREPKLEAMRALVEHLIPGRWAEVRRPTAKELRATSIMALPITEASAKLRTGGPLDDEEDYALPLWAGVVPLALTPSQPIDDDRLRDGATAPTYVTRYRRPTAEP